MVPLIPGYTLRSRLAVGGMAELFLGQRSDGRAVVIKRALTSADPRLLALLAREGEALSAVDDANVVACLEVGADYLVLEYVDGPDLGALLGHLRRRGRQLPLSAAAAVVEGLCRGLAALHESPLGMAHRDVNPANLLVGPDGVVKVADLGLVRIAASPGASLAGLKGTLNYMAPEQLAGRDADARTDVYAAALVAYEAVTGVPARPPGAIGVGDLVAARSRLPAAPSAVQPGLPAAVDRLLLAALEPDPARRPGDIRRWGVELVAAFGTAPDGRALAELAATVQRSVAPATQTLGPDEAPGQPPPPRARRRTRLAVGAFALAALAAAGAWLATRPSEPGAAARPQGTAETSIAPVAPPPSEVAPAPPPAPDAVATVSPDPDPSGPDAGSSEDVGATTPAPPDASAPAEPPPVAPTPQPRQVRVRVDSTLGYLRVAGAGANGAAPRATGWLPQGTSVIKIAGAVGRTALPATLRVTRRGEALSLTVSAGAGKRYEAVCAGGASRSTPVQGLTVGPGGVQCTLTDPDGNALGFRVTAERK